LKKDQSFQISNEVNTKEQQDLPVYYMVGESLQGSYI
jgi:hypothetical protein